MRFTPALLALLLAASAAVRGATAQPAAAASGRQLPQAYATNHLELEIPFKISPGSGGAAPTAVQVYVSWDFGRNWHKYAEVPADAGKFRFKAKKDAEFWFVTETQEATDRAPSEIAKWPQMRLVIDTQKPDLQATAAVTPAGQVELNWSAADPNLNPHSLKIEYQDARDEDAPWETVTIPQSQLSPSRGGLAGRILFVPQPGLHSVNLRAEVADAASNKSYFHQQLAIPATHDRPQDRPLPSPLAMDAGARRWPSDNVMSGESRPDTSTAVEKIARPSPTEDLDASGIVSNPHVPRGRLTAGTSTSGRAEELAPPQPESTLPPPADRPDTPSDVSGDSSRPTFPKLAPPEGTERNRARMQTLPDSSDLSPRKPTLSNADIGPILDQELPPGQEALPPPASAEEDGSSSRDAEVVTTDSIPAGIQPRLTSTKRFSLDYDVESVGPEGIAEVELWGTNDGGRTWLKWGADPDRTSPMDVEVTSEATYGFRVVILGKNGLEGNKPQPGDDADIWVSIDVTRPAARILAAAYGQGADAGKLDIRWEAADVNLAQRPVTLLYSERPDGRFAVIAAGLENTGHYLWQFDPRSPRSIYLRLEVRDEAGNVAIDQLREPISIEGLIPKGRIRSLSPAPEPLPQSGAFDSPLLR